MIMEPARMFFYQQKLYLLVVLCTLIVSTQQQVKDPTFMQNFIAMKQDCAKEEGADLAAISKAWAENRFPNDQKFKCFYKCLNTKLGVLDANGDVVDDKLKDVVTQLEDVPTREEIVEECGPLKGADLCETAYKLMACIKAAKLD